MFGGDELEGTDLSLLILKNPGRTHLGKLGTGRAFDVTARSD